MNADHILDSSAIEPAPEQLQALLKGNREEAVYMLNLLAFYEQAIYPENSGFAPCSGREAYMRYGQHAEAKVKELGGRIEFNAACGLTIIGQKQEWHAVAIVYYPSRTAFIDMAVSMQQHPEALIHRRAGLKKTILIQTSTQQAMTQQASKPA